MRGLKWLIAIVVIAGLCRLFPLFHVVPLERATSESEEATFDPVKYAQKFWDEQLIKSLHKAVKAEVLLRAIQNSPAAAKEKYSRSPGLGESYIYFISGNGRVLAVSDDEVSLAVTDGMTKSEISLQTGLIFGNAVRDGTGLLNVNDYPNSQDFNAISEALNRIIEERVLPKLREQARVGARIHFSGCAEVDDEATDLAPLKVVPVEAALE